MTGRENGDYGDRKGAVDIRLGTVLVLVIPGAHNDKARLLLADLVCVSPGHTISPSLSFAEAHSTLSCIRLALCTSSKFTKGLPLNRCRRWDARLGGGVIKYIKELPAAMDSLTNFIGSRAVDR